MKGDTKSAEKFLTAAKHAFPRKENNPGEYSISAWEAFSALPEQTALEYRTSQFYGDLGAAHLARDHYFDALTALYKASFREDAAYIAERILSREELLEYIRKHFPSPAKLVPAYGRLELEGPIGGDARFLLARRLARDRYFKDARPFFLKIYPVFDRYVKLIRESRSPDVSSKDRAAALWGSRPDSPERWPRTLRHRRRARLRGQGRGFWRPVDRRSQGGTSFQKTCREEIKQSSPLQPPKNATASSAAACRTKSASNTATSPPPSPGKPPNACQTTPRNRPRPGHRRKLAQRPRSQSRGQILQSHDLAQLVHPTGTRSRRQTLVPHIEWTYDPFAAAATPRPEGL